jgi:hypothetical protein
MAGRSSTPTDPVDVNDRASDFLTTTAPVQPEVANSTTLLADTANQHSYRPAAPALAELAQAIEPAIVPPQAVLQTAAPSAPPVFPLAAATVPAAMAHPTVGTNRKASEFGYSSILVWSAPTRCT